MIARVIVEVGATILWITFPIVVAGSIVPYRHLPAIGVSKRIRPPRITVTVH